MGLVEPLIREKGDFVDVEFDRPEVGRGIAADSGGLAAD
jgi:hypothetical protein